MATKQYTLHGLRKSAACAVAEAGTQLPAMMAIFGWRSPDMALHYIREANKEKLIGDGVDLWERVDRRKLRLVKSAA